MNYKRWEKELPIYKKGIFRFISLYSNTQNELRETRAQLAEQNARNQALEDRINNANVRARQDLEEIVQRANAEGHDLGDELIDGFIRKRPGCIGYSLRKSKIIRSLLHSQTVKRKS